MKALVVVVALAAHAYAEPRLAAPYAVAIDAASGQTLFARRADEARPIASLTKLFAALALRELDLDAWTEIAPADARAAAGGARSLLAVGRAFHNRDLLAAMLLVSDNRVPTALARSAGLDEAALLARMRNVATDLGLAHTHLATTTGLGDDVSTARELALAMRAAIREPALRTAMTERTHRVASRDGAVVVDYRTTVSPLANRRYAIRGGKTGWTTEAGYCIVVAAVIGKRTVVIAMLGAPRIADRYDDFITLAEYLDHPDRDAAAAVAAVRAAPR